MPRIDSNQAGPRNNHASLSLVRRRYRIVFRVRYLRGLHCRHWHRGYRSECKSTQCIVHAAKDLLFI